MKISETPQGMDKYTVAHQRKRKWLKVVTCLAAVVVFCTTYALILPAITLDKDHTLDCSYTVHQHDENCYDEDGELICGYADYVVHTHQEDYCYDESGNLICGLDTAELHEHDDSCYQEKSVLVCEETESDGHEHSADCYTRVQGELTCEQSEGEGHAHDDSCYTKERGELECQEEHEHTDDCYAWTEELTCGKEEGEGAHTHTDDCYAWTEELTCGKEEGEGAHHHTDDCYETKTELTCEKPEIILHTHGDDCWEDILDENDKVIGQKLVCGKIQVEAHQHDDACIASASNGDADIELTSQNGIPEEILNKLAAEANVYPGTAKDGVWTVYDTGSAETASIKATVTLPEGTTVAADHYLYIREVQDGEGYYPKQNALETAVGDDGDYSDVQCYSIHWVHIYQENGEWRYNLETDSVLGGANGGDDSASPASVQIEYLKEDAYLQGSSAHRKLIVFNSRNSEGTKLEDASTPTAVTATNDAYTGFTFETNRGGPYVFVSKTLYPGYVSSVTIDKIIDGASPFDGNDEAGNDSKDSNKIIRSYDMITYDLVVNRAARSSGITATEGNMEFEMTMDADITEAVFATGSMLWLGNDYTIEYLNEAGQVVLTQGSDGKYRNAEGKTVTVNDMVSGSDQDFASYTSTIVSQRLRGKVHLEEENILAGNRTYSAAVQVLNAANESTINPTFRVWFEGNEDNYGSENPLEGTSVQLAQKITDNRITADEVTVSAAARFNLELAKNANVSYKSWFDSRNNNEVSSVSSYTVGGKTVTGGQMHELLEALGQLDENIGRSAPETFTDSEGACSSYLNGLQLSDYKEVFQNIRYGRITGYGVTLQVYNDATGDQNDASKGFKGVSLPQGEITFDLALGTTITEVTGNIDQTQYYAQLWEYNENVDAAIGNQNRNMYWANLASTRYAAWAAPYNSGGVDNSHCYNGGSWSLENSNDNSYSFKVSGYDLSFLSTGLEFPTHKAGNSGASTGYNTYIGSFSAGYVQVLNVFPRIQSATFTLGTNVTVKDLQVTTTDNQTISAGAEDETGYAHETNGRDNSLNDSIPLYAPGGITKANAFCNAACFDTQGADFTGKSYFLGTDFWGTSYDCSAFAGQKITLVGAARINAGDAVIKHMNMLQLFDSEALSIDSSKKQPYVYTKVAESNVGTTRILYAADPDYRNGYDTNADGMQEYMSTVREEDLIYYESLTALEDAGYTCVGVLAELRNCTIYGEGGYGTALKIPMTVSEDEKFLTKTVSTVNTVRIWTSAEDMEHGTVSWKDGVYDPATGKNSVEGYSSINNGDDTHYRGQVANGSAYEKTEYENGKVVLSSNTGGYVYGSSLLILGYKSTVDIEVDNGGTGELPTYDMDKGNYTVNYHLKEIQAKIEDEAGKPQVTTTDLVVLAKLDTAKEEDTEQRISVATTGYQMKAASDHMQLVSSTEANCEVLESVSISTDPNHPTTVYYRLAENLNPPEGEEIDWKYYTIQVYAVRDTNGTQVTFQLSDVTVDVGVPDITFDALIDPNAVRNNDRIDSSAYISGTSDVRAYATTNGNMDSATIGIVRLRGTNLVKAVDKHYIELNGVFTYTVTYANTGNEPVSVYLYDLLPDPDDIRGSSYDGINSTVTLRDVDANLSGEDGFTADIQFYYSTLAYTDLYDNVKVFGSVDTDTEETITDIGKRKEQIQRMLSNKRLFNPLGTINSSSNYEFMSDSSFDDMTDEAITEIMEQVTGIYAVINNLGGGKTLSIEFTVETENNKAGDLYRNIANSWLGDNTEPLTSNLVETTVLSREISGVVWYDANLNGVRDSNEETIPNVTCTLFKWDENAKEYVPCTKDITGADITTVTTGEGGAYSFTKLATGEYIVAFSGKGLEKYNGATIHQVKGSHDATSNDAVALTPSTKSNIDTETSIAGIGSGIYKYAIAYSLTNSGAATRTADDDNTVVNAVSLHTIEDIIGNNVPLTNNVELYENLDCGLVVFAGPELPMTGGSGTIPYTIGGLLIIGAGLILLYIQRRKESSASS